MSEENRTSANTTPGTLPRRGLVIYPNTNASEVVELAQAADTPGYSNVWFGDSQNNWREVTSLMGATAVGTKNVVIGTGVTNTVTRHPAVFASMWATVAELSGGRAAVGIGTGFTALGTIGRKPVSLKTLEASVKAFGDLTQGRSVVEDTTGTEYRLAYLTDRPLRIPVYVAASGPAALRLAGRIADGVILLVGTASECITEALGYVREGAEQAGRTLADIDVVLWAQLAIAEDPAQARDRVRGPVARMVMRWLPMELPARVVPAIEHLRTFASEYEGSYYGHLVAKPEHSKQVPDEVVDSFALAGTPDEVTRRLPELAAAGVNQIAATPAYGTSWARQFDAVRAFAPNG
ncbi:LLM class flavin-dependent oxidoreductase [Saccharopolyspora spinosa]|uniref:Methylenetetrahydromethanopterin reductase n=1 Tax=Saccharopolyspora spinosa TaxID=60894 RepID=A0A2N3Y1W0_SACSN|nr:LLM class flavin-dependent oxidoreductase [Saccharopolyspora spinosa]PKW16831.1 methylenetetrahydromethanopterin reductase [Saccharopolyspora spinosa]